MEDGSFWDPGMNSFNHYAYGSVIDWVYTVAAGIRTCEDAPGYEKICIEPHPDPRLDHLTVTLDSRRGRVISTWRKQDNTWRYEITTPTDTEIIIDRCSHTVPAGRYIFYGECK